LPPRANVLPTHAAQLIQEGSPIPAVHEIREEPQTLEEPQTPEVRSTHGVLPILAVLLIRVVLLIPGGSQIHAACSIHGDPSILVTLRHTCIKYQQRPRPS
jgi:hypothetical protein